MKRKDIKNKLLNECYFSAVTFNNDGGITAKKSYFYRSQAGTHDQMKEKIKQTFKDSEIEFLDEGNHFRPFKGGSEAGSATDSWIYVKFKFKEKSSD